MKHTVKAGLAALAATTLPFAGAAYAEDRPAVTSASASTSSITQEQEIALMSEAFSESRKHAKAGFNIGLVLHVGDDIPAAQIEAVAEYFRNRYQSTLDAKFPNQNGSVKIFTRPNPGSPSSGLTVDIGDQMFQVENAKYGLGENSDPSLLDLMTADEAAEEAVDQLPASKAIQLRNDRNQTASLSSVTPG